MTQVNADATGTCSTTATVSPGHHGQKPRREWRSEPRSHASADRVDAGGSSAPRSPWPCALRSTVTVLGLILLRRAAQRTRDPLCRRPVRVPADRALPGSAAGADQRHRCLPAERDELADGVPVRRGRGRLRRSWRPAAGSVCAVSPTGRGSASCIGCVRLVQLPGLPFRGPDPPAQSRAAGLPLGLGPPDRRFRATAGLPVDPGALDRRPPATDPGRCAGPMGLRGSRSGRPLRRRRQSDYRRHRPAGRRGRDRSAFPGDVRLHADDALRRLGRIPPPVRPRRCRSIRRPGAMAQRSTRLAAGRRRRRAFLAVLFLSDYFAGRALYGALATYHAYLEFPVLLALVMSPLTVRPVLRE